MKKINLKKGYSLVEVLITMSILSGLVIVSGLFQKDIFSFNTNIQSSLNAQLDARHLVKVMISELRKTSPSTTGAYPIELASSTGITFYSDVDGNGSIEKVRYFLSGSTIRKGVIAPTGNPAVYNSGNEVFTTLVNSVVASSTLPIFKYYSSSYTGTTSPLAFPVDIPSVRLVNITVIIDNNPNRSPIPVIVTSSVSLRNLKDNL